VEGFYAKEKNSVEGLGMVGLVIYKKRGFGIRV